MTVKTHEIKVFTQWNNWNEMQRRRTNSQTTCYPWIYCKMPLILNQIQNLYEKIPPHPYHPPFGNGFLLHGFKKQEE